MKKDNTANLTWYDHHRNKGSTPHMRKGIVSYCCCHMLGCYSADILRSFFWQQSALRVGLRYSYDNVQTVALAVRVDSRINQKVGQRGWGGGLDTGTEQKLPECGDYSLILPSQCPEHENLKPIFSQSLYEKHENSFQNLSNQSTYRDEINCTLWLHSYLSPYLNNSFICTPLDGRYL